MDYFAYTDVVDGRDQSMGGSDRCTAQVRRLI